MSHIVSVRSEPRFAAGAGAALFGAACLVSVFAMPQESWADAIGPDFADVVEEVLPAVVHISIEARQLGVNNPDNFPRYPNDPQWQEFFDQFGVPPHGGAPGQYGNNPPDMIVGSGSGFIIDEKGYVVTNHHVVNGAETVTVTLPDGMSYEADVVGVDERTDLALVHIDADRTFPTVAWGDSEGLRIGNWIIAVGSPFGFSGTVTAGILSATGRDLRAGPYDDYLQFDASINPGNSGGPVFDINGNVVGVSTAIYTPSNGNVGLGFAVPQSLAEPVIAALMEDGGVERGFIGVTIQHVSPEVAEAMGLDRAYGALVSEVNPGGPADMAGVQSGDVIIGFNGETVDTMRDLPRMVAMTAPGSEGELEIWRNGEIVVSSIDIGTLPGDLALAGPDNGRPSNPETVRLPALGIAVGAIDADMAPSDDPNLGGVMITDIRHGSTAEAAGLQIGDIVAAVGPDPVETPADLRDRISALQDDGRPSVLLLIRRADGAQYVPVPFEG